MKYLAGFVVTVWWLAGVVLAHGALPVFCAAIFPPYAWYLVVERLMQTAGVV